MSPARLALCVILFASSGACARSSPEAAPEALEPARPGAAGLANTVAQDGIEVGFVDGVPEDRARLILAEALRARTANGTGCRRSWNSGSTTRPMPTSRHCGSASKQNGVEISTRSPPSDPERPG